MKRTILLLTLMSVLGLASCGSESTPISPIDTAVKKLDTAKLDSLGTLRLDTTKAMDTTKK